MSSINSRRTYELGAAYESIKNCPIDKSCKCLLDPEVVSFNDVEKSITFTTEQLIPARSTQRPRVMLLFSNPHPLSVQKGMFLSPNIKGRENLFWPTMQNAGWITITEKVDTPGQLADICLNVRYQGPFELIFHCYYAFPTDYPQEINKIFGREYFHQHIEPEAIKEFMEIVQNHSVEAVVVFNKDIFNHVTNGKRIENYMNRLEAGELIQGQIKAIDRFVPVFLTFPTGWRYHKQYMQFRKASLEKIRTAITEGQSSL